MQREANLILLPLVILLTLPGGGHLAARTLTPSDPPLIRLQVVTFDTSSRGRARVGMSPISTSSTGSRSTGAGF